MTELGSLVLFSSRVGQTAAFYRALGLDLVAADHGDGEHFATVLNGIRVAVLDAEAVPDRGSAWREAGSTFPGFWVDSLETALTAVTRLGAPLLVAHQRIHTGCRAVLKDPDGRTIEVNQRGHCPG